MPFTALIVALRGAFLDAAIRVPPRHSHTLDVPNRPSATLLLMPAWRAGGRLGIKTVTVFPGNAAHGRAALASHYLLFDANDGRLLARIDGDVLTARRTAAASALAASALARADARRLLVVGSGRVAAAVPEAMRAVRPIEAVEVWSRNAANAASLVGALRRGGMPASVATDLESAVRRADIVSCATLATAPLVRGRWLADGSHLDLVGSFTPAMRECDADGFARSRVFVDTDEALVKSGDVLEAIRAGAFAAADVQGTLASLVRTAAGGRRGDAEITLFKSVGTALEDLAAAELAYDRHRVAN